MAGVSDVMMSYIWSLLKDNVHTTTGDITYYSVLHDFGTRTFSYHAFDYHGDCSEDVIITVNITFVNYPPFPIRPLEAESLEDTPIIIKVSYYFDDVQVPPWVVGVEASEGDWHFVDPSVQDHHFLIYYKPPL